MTGEYPSGEDYGSGYAPAGLIVVYKSSTASSNVNGGLWSANHR